MRRLLLLGAACLLVLLGSVDARPADPPPKTIILGIDGMDHGLTRQFLDEGLLPNFQRLAAAGAFLPVWSSNPPQSNVAWAVFNSGQNPGKTGLEGFVSRTFGKDEATGERKGVLPQLQLGFPDEIPADEFVGFPLALRQPLLFGGLAAGVAALVLLLLFRLVRLPWWVAGLAALGGGGGGWWLALDYAGRLPADGMVPYESNPMQGTNWWTWLDQAGIRLCAVQPASTFPPDEEGPNTRLLAGFGVKDVGGSPGSWFVFTDDEWTFGEGDLGAGGTLHRFTFDQADARDAGESRATIDLLGPRNWIVEKRFQQQLRALEGKQAHRDNSSAETTRWEQELGKVKNEFERWRRSERKTRVRFQVDRDLQAGTLSFDVQGTTFTLRAGEWSDYVPVEFVLNEWLSVHGITRFQVMRCDDEEVRFFVPPVNLDPFHPPEFPPISSPPEFAAELAAGIQDHYQTLGWACLTNPLKDSELTKFGPEPFLHDIAEIMARQEDLLAHCLSRPATWDVYFQLFATPDRVCHMLLREMDPGHPTYDEGYANRQVTVWGRTFPLKDAVREVYREMDRIVGSVLTRLEAGEFGTDCLLMTVADHGFTSFRRGVNLNNVLHELGFLKTKNDRPLADFTGADGRQLRYVDWARTRAYSMGLAQVYVNLQGREPDGIVAPEDYAEVVAQLQQNLRAVKDPADGAQVISEVWHRDEIFSGPWVKEGSAERKLRGTRKRVEHDGFADLLVGYMPVYRVSWGNTLGDLDAAAIVDNDQHWTGDHVSSDTRWVRGAFFCSQPFLRPVEPALVDVGPTVLARYGIDPTGKDIDGSPLPIRGAGE